MLTAIQMKESAYHRTAEEIDAELIQVKAAQDDPRRFEPLYKNYYKRILSFVYHRLDNKEQAFEITAQVFYRALDKLHSFKPQGLPFSAWLFRIAANELNQWFRQQKARRTVNIDENGLSGLKESMEDSALIDKRLFAALEELDEEEMELIDMRFFEQRSFKEISEIKNIGESACKMRTYRILEKLKTTLQNTQ